MKKKLTRARPIPISSVFLANFVALLGLALLFGSVVNVISAFLFPAIVTLKDGSLAAFLRVALAHWSTVFLASVFSFFSLFGLVGVLMLILPRKMFRQASVFVRMLMVVVLLIGFFSNLLLQLFSGKLPGQAGAVFAWLPPMWFLGLYQKNLGIATTSATVGATRAVLAVILAVSVSVGAYALCYRRYFLRLPEMPEIAGTRKRLQFSIVELILNTISRTGAERAAAGFMWKVITRSERHLMFFGSYMGLGIVLVSQIAADSLARRHALDQPDPNLLAIPLAVMFFLASGLRFAFDLAAALRCNWIFRISIAGTEIPFRSFTRRLLWTYAIPLPLAVWFCFIFTNAGLGIALISAALSGVWTVLLVEILLPARYQKIPFTYSVPPDTRRLVRRILCVVLTVLIAIPLFAHVEWWALATPVRSFLVLMLSVLGLVVLRNAQRANLSGNSDLVFEEQSPEAFELLRLV